LDNGYTAGVERIGLLGGSRVKTVAFFSYHYSKREGSPPYTTIQNGKVSHQARGKKLLLIPLFKIGRFPTKDYVGLERIGLLGGRKVTTVVLLGG